MLAHLPARYNYPCPGCFPLAGFEVTAIGRIWGDHRGEAIRANAETQQHSNESQLNTEPERVAVAVELSESEAGRYYAEQRSAYVLQQWMLLLAVGTLLAAIGYAVITYFQWRTMDKTFQEAKKQTCVQRDASMNAERAWVGLSQTPQVEVSSLALPRFTAAINLSIHNFGKGPALNMMAGSQLATHGHVQEVQNSTCDTIFPFVGISPKRPVFSSRIITQTQWGTVLFPGQPPFTYHEDTGGEAKNVLGQEVFVVGCIVYRDQFGNPHWTKFSYSTGPYVSQVVRSASAFHQLYESIGNNYTDDAQKKQSCSSN